MFNKLFDLNADGRLDAAEQALEHMTFLEITGEEEEASQADREDTDG